MLRIFGWSRTESGVCGLDSFPRCPSTMSRKGIERGPAQVSARKQTSQSFSEIAAARLAVRSAAVMANLPKHIEKSLISSRRILHRFRCPVPYLDFICHAGRNAQKQQILGARSFQFAVYRIRYLEGVRRRGFWARLNGSNSAVRNA